MTHGLLRWLGSGLVALTLTATLAAQSPAKQTTTPSGSSPTSVERGPPIAAYAFAIITTLVVVAVVALRSRK